MSDLIWKHTRIDVNKHNLKQVLSMEHLKTVNIYLYIGIQTREKHRITSELNLSNMHLKHS